MRKLSHFVSSHVSTKDLWMGRSKEVHEAKVESQAEAVAIISEEFYSPSIGRIALEFYLQSAEEGFENGSSFDRWKSHIRELSGEMRMYTVVKTSRYVFAVLVCVIPSSQSLPGSSIRPVAYERGAAIAESMAGAENIAPGVAALVAMKGVQGKSILISEFSTIDFVPDGDLNKKAWATANKSRFDRDAFQRTEYPELETVAASRWTENYLYLAYWCKYKTLNTYQGEDPRAERWELWERDVVEAFINPQPAQLAHYYEFEIAPNNQWLDLEIDLQSKQPHNAQWNSGFEHATRGDPARHIWTVEMRIPMRSMGVQRIGLNTDWRINLYRADGPGSGEKSRLLSWSPLAIPNNSFHQPASFGILKFTSPVRSRNFQR